MAPPHIPAPVLRQLLGPLLPALPAAAFSAQPAPGVLLLLSPILRQRVQLLSSSSNEPWLGLLSYDAAKAVKLGEAARSAELEPHPVSGEVEVDWDYDVETRYRRLDVETIQALVALKTLDLVFQLVYCTGDQEGGGDGWRVGEVSVPDKPSPFSIWGGMSTLADAESDFIEKEATQASVALKTTGGDSLQVGSWHSSAAPMEQEDEDDDDDYWARYDATPAGRTPAANRSPVPAPIQQSTQSTGPGLTAAENAYFAQYDSVQPAMDNHDPDEAAAAAAAGVDISSPAVTAAPAVFQPAEPPAVAPPLGLLKTLNSQSDDLISTDADETSRVWMMVEKETKSLSSNEDRMVDLVHPQPAASNASSSGSQTVARLEKSAGRKDQSEFGIKQHVGRTVRSLFSLSRAAGIDREEFERLVKTELDMLAMIEDQEHI